MKVNNVYSDLKIAWFPDKLNSFKNNIVTAPIYVRIKPINKCCHNCGFCVYNSSYSNMHNTMNKVDTISKEKLFEILNDFKDMGVKAVTYSGGGEPLLHPNITEVMRKTINNNIDLSIITNGELLSEDNAKVLANAKWIRISMDYCNAAMFKQSRGGSETRFIKIIDNIRNFSNIKSNECTLSINYIITKENYTMLYDAAKLLKELKVDNVRMFPVLTTDENFINYHKPLEKVVLDQLKHIRNELSSDNYKTYDSYNITKYEIDRKYTTCYIMQTVPAIGADCNVYNCHNKSYTTESIIGSIKNQSFKEMWFSEKTKKHFKLYNPKNYCKCQCANDGKNIFINELMKCNEDNYV